MVYIALAGDDAVDVLIIDQVYTFGQSIQNRWVAVGTGPPNTLAYSNDGITWTAVTGPFGSGYAISVAYANGTWVAVGKGSGNNNT